MQSPETRYVRTDAGAIAYQQWGKGDTVILVFKVWHLSIDAMWDEPGLLRLWEACGSVGRCVAFDYRGLGVSDQVPLAFLGDPTGWRDDALAVLDDLGVDRVVVYAEGDAPSTAAVLLAIAEPRRVQRLLLSNCRPCGAIPEGASEEDVTVWAEAVGERWGTGVFLASRARTR